MKNAAIVSVMLSILLFFSECKKSTCHTCTLPCETCTVTNGYFCETSVTTTSFCGTAQDVQAWETGMRAQYPSTSGYCCSFASVTSSGSAVKQVCGTDDGTNSAIATYTSAGYTCN